MNKYIIKLDDENNIIEVAYTFDYAETDIEITHEEYEAALKYKKFNPKTRKFSVPVIEDIKEE